MKSKESVIHEGNLEWLCSMVVVRRADIVAAVS
jgi:hypothetical protein